MATAPARIERQRTRASDAHGGCAHCGSPLPAVGRVMDEQQHAFCCAGCAAVAKLLHDSGLDRYYDLRQGREAPIVLTEPSRRDLAWLEPMMGALEGPGVHVVALDIQGVHCSACVWVVEQLFRRSGGAVRVVLDPALGRLELWVKRGFDLGGFVRGVERFGYKLGPSTKKVSRGEDALLVRTAIVIALAMNAMTFALALYFGLADGIAATAARVLEGVLAGAAVVIGAPPILRSAWTSIREGLLSLDVPIALGIVLAGASTAVSAVVHHDPGYADTLAVFVALVLVGRWLTERTLRGDRDRLLEDPGTDGLYARRVDASGTHVVRASSIATGDELALGPGEVVPVAATLRATSTFAFDWISGEPEPRTLEAGERVPAGAVHASTTLVHLRADEDFRSSALRTLLTRPTEARVGHASAFWERTARYYVAAVLLLATLTFAGWMLITGDPARALDATTALLVVTCPCGLGIATPLAYTLALSALRRRGLFVRRADLLDRMHDVRRVVFDKTGTLTTGRPHLATRTSLDALSTADRARLVGLARSSSHPASAAIADATSSEPAIVLDDVREVVGAGVEGRLGSSVVRLGRADWAVSGADASGDVVFSIDGRERARFALEETLRDDAKTELNALGARGLDLHVLSGDAADRVTRIASALGIDADHAEGAASPEKKAARIGELDRSDTMFVGDGLNDALAVSRAFVSGTPSIERPFVAGRADFYFVTAGLAPIRALFEVADRVRSVARTNLVVAILYNVIAVSVAMLGFMRPWLAAVLMPLSSIAVVSLSRVRMQELAWTR